MFRIPGTNIRFGLDFIIGWIPGVGDLVAGLASLVIIVAAWRRGRADRDSRPHDYKRRPGDGSGLDSRYWRCVSRRVEGESAELPAVHAGEESRLWGEPRLARRDVFPVDGDRAAVFDQHTGRADLLAHALKEALKLCPSDLRSAVPRARWANHGITGPWQSQLSSRRVRCRAARAPPASPRRGRQSFRSPEKGAAGCPKARARPEPRLESTHAS